MDTTREKMIDDQGNAKPLFDLVHQPDCSTKSTYCSRNGSICNTNYELLDGVSLVDKYVNITEFVSKWRRHSVPILVIEHCREGSLICQMDDERLEIHPGDISIFRTDNNFRTFTYPTGQYHATAIYINLEQMDPGIENCLKIAGCDIEQLMKSYGLDQRYFCVLRGNVGLQRLFDELYSAPQEVKRAYWGVKVHEVLVLLAAHLSQDRLGSIKRISGAQVVAAREVHRYIMERLNERIEIEELAKKFSFSPTQIKEGFRAVYGVPIQTFAREQRMHAAAVALQDENLRVREVAERFGYINISKFSAAFRAVIGKTPTQYRRTLSYKAALSGTDAAEIE